MDMVPPPVDSRRNRLLIFFRTMMNKYIQLTFSLLVSLILSAPAAVQTWSAGEFAWVDSGGALSTVSGDTLTIIASKNSRVTATLPESLTISESGEKVSVSFDLTVSGDPFADDGSTLRVGFQNSTYGYYAAFEPAGGASQAIFGETDDTNLGRFDVLAMGSTGRTVRFILEYSAVTEVDLTAAGTLVDEADNFVTVEPDILPAGTTFDTVYIYLGGNLWSGGQTLTLSNLTIEAVQATPPPSTNSTTFLVWAASHGLRGDDALELSDPDADRLSNLIEFATGGDPAQIDPQPVTGRFDGENSFLVTYPRRKGGSGTNGMNYFVEGITYTLEFCDSLISNVWKSGTGVVETVGSPVAETNGITERVTLRLAATNSTGFVRLRVQSSSGSAVATSPLERLENGSFELGDTGWSADGLHTIVNDPVHSGTAALRYEAPDSYAGAQVFYIVGGRKYRFSGWIKTGDDYTGEAGVSLNFRDRNAGNLGSVTAGGIRFGAGTDWTQMVEIVEAPANAAKMKVLLVTGGTGGVWYDDLSVTPYEHPPDPAVDTPANPPISGTWTATFTDEFDGEELDGGKWRLGGLNGFAVTAAERCSVSNGILTICAAPIPGQFKETVSDWSSASISTYRKFSQLYGYFEARIRYETKVGMWPAFWTVPNREWYGDTSENRKVWMQFDLSGQPDSVAHAELKLTASAVTGRETVLNIFPAPDNWIEDTITWNNMPVENPLWLAHDWIPVVQPGDELSYDLTDYINRQLAGDRVAGLVLSDTFQQIVLLSLYSREAADPASRPQLILDGVALEPFADATVRSGSYADINAAADSELEIKESWQRDNRSTENGGMEIDVFEWLGVWEPYRLHSALHWDGYFAEHKSTNFPFYVVGNTVAEYHTYGFYWEPGLIEFYFDGESTGGIFESNRVCTIPSTLILCLQMGGWSGNGNLDNIDESEYPGLMEVDYVKAWSGTRD